MPPQIICRRHPAAARRLQLRNAKHSAAAAGHIVDRVVVVYEAGYSGFWLARWLAQGAPTA